MFVLVSVKPEYRNICEQYWEYDRGFIHSSQIIARNFDITTEKLLNVVKNGCLAYVEDYRCDGCGDPMKYFQLREQYSLETSNIAAARDKREKGFFVLCAECEAKKPLNLNLLSLAASLYIAQVDLQEMEESFVHGAYESLNAMQYNFLKNLSKAQDYHDACRISGIHPKKGRQTLTMLSKLYLLSFSQDEQGYYILPALSDALKKADVAKPVFGSKKAEELFRLLKSLHYAVFPEIHLCTFINIKHIRHVFWEPWEEKYFYFSRVDFLVCDRDGIPCLAVEFDGGYHVADSTQQKKDELKESILQAAGIKVARYTGQDLQQ